MVKVRGGNSHKTKIVLASLTASAVLTVTRPAMFPAVYAAANTFEWERREDVDRLGGSYSSAARSANGTHLILSVGFGGEGTEEVSPLYVSSNSGASWENVAPELDPGVRNMWTSADVSNDGQTMVATSDWGVDVDTSNTVDGKIFLSEDAGSTWANVSPVGAEEWDQVVVSGNGNRIIAVDGDYEELYVSDDGGDTWLNPGNDYFWNIKSISVSDDGEKILVGGENDSPYTELYISENDGVDWANISPGPVDTLFEIEHDISSDGTKIIAATNGFGDGDSDSVYVSDDSGQSWTDSYPDTEGTSYWVDAAISDDGSVVSVIGENSIFMSSDFGDSWTEEDPGQAYEDSNAWVEGDFNSDGTKMIMSGEDNAYITTEAEAGIIILEPDGDASKAILIEQLEGTVICSAFEDSTFTRTEPQLEAQDGAYDYASYLVGFTMTGCDVGGTTTMRLLFTGDFDITNVVLRKYNSVTKSFKTIENAVITETTLNDLPAIDVRYQITDGGELDQDGVANGTIVDPVGLGSSASAGVLAETGSNTQLLTAMAIASTSTAALYLLSRLNSKLDYSASKRNKS
ncbi:hypothetical protein KBD20_02920 [Candidatus Saccharibacteria bacterium]|nr:hypothetical protein [Candidatus Saccharibacteria bacterium]